MASRVLKPFFIGSAVLGLLLTYVPNARAAEPSPSEIGVARRLFSEGRAAEDARRWREAAERFRSAIAIKDTPGLRFHLARCEEEQGALVEALVEYDRARELLETGVKAPDVEKLLTAARERVRAKVAQLSLQLPAGVQGVSVELDGKALAGSVLGQPIPVNPGKHQLAAVAAGRRKFVGDVELGQGEAKLVALELPPEPVSPPAVTAAEPRTAPAKASALTVAPRARVADDGFSTRTWVLIGEGTAFVAGLATGVAFQLAKSKADDDATNAGATLTDSHACADPAPRDSENCGRLRTALDDSRRNSTLAAVGFVGAGVSAAAFGITYLLWPNDEPPAKVHARASHEGWFVSLGGDF